MKNFKNNYRRNRYRSNGDRSFYKNSSDQKLNSDFLLFFTEIFKDEMVSVNSFAIYQVTKSRHKNTDDICGSD